MSGILQTLFLGAAAAVKDAYFNLVTLLLPGNGTNGAQNNTFLDSSTNNFTITRNGNTTQGTFSPFSQTGWGNYFDGSSYLSIPANAVFQFGTGDFTIELWAYTTSTARQVIFGNYSSSGATYGWAIQINVNSTGDLFFGWGNSTIANPSGVWTANQWNQIVVSRSGTTTKIFVNGVQASSVSDTTNYNNGNNVVIGRNADLGQTAFSYSGYVSNARVTKGGALYTSAFTPPTSPLTTTVSAGTVSLLTCQSNRFIDNSTNAFTITTSGSPSVQAFSPFAPTAAYSSSVVGGSGYFDGSGDYLSVADNTALNMGSSDFTIEMWWYPNAAPGSTAGLYGKRANNSTVAAINLASSTGLLITAVATVDGSSWGLNITASTACKAGAWNHVAFTRSTNTWTLWLNGASVASGTLSGTIPTNTSNTTIGAGAADGSTAVNAGYISGFRIVKGTAVYTGAFTPPTAPPTAISNTSLLANYTNAGITDATAKNDLETVGNAQISTTQSKFGGSSMYFDGTGDYLFQSGNPPQNALGTGDFTIEYWVYFSSLSGSTASVILDYRPSSTAGAYPTMYINTSFKLTYEANSGVRINSSTTITTGTWYHVAFVRASGSTKLYLNGTNEGSTYSDTTNYLGSAGRPIVAADGYNLGSQAMNGYIDDLRITKGYARYTTNFTPPTAAFPIQ